MRARLLDEGVTASRPCVHDHCGVETRDSALAFLMARRVLNDQSLAPSERVTLLKRVVFGTAEISDQKAADALWDAFGMDVLGQHADECANAQKVFDWDSDAGRIRASILQQFGLDWDEIAGTRPFSDVVDMLSALTESGETPFERAVYYRTAHMPEGLSPQGEAAWRRNKSHFDFLDTDDPYGDALMREVANG